MRRVLLIRLRSIGDTVLMTPCLAALKAFRPDIEIAVLMEPLSAPVLEDHPLVDKLFVSEKYLASRMRFIAKPRRERFDVAFNMHGGATATIIARLAGARHSVGYRGHRHSWMLSHRAPSPDVILGRARIHSVEQQLALLHWTGVPWPASRPQLSLTISDEAQASVRKRLMMIKAPQSGFAAIAPAAAMESKRWTTGGFAAVADHLSERWNLPGIIIAGPGQESVAQKVSEAARSHPHVIGGLSLKELMALIEMAQLFVGNDSGPMHIAAALRRPVVVVFGSSNATVWHPWTDAPYRVVRRHEDAQTQIRGDAARVDNLIDGESSLAIRQVPESDVTSAVDEVLESALGAGFKADASFQPQIAK